MSDNVLTIELGHPPREYLIAQLIAVDRDLLALERLLGQPRTPHLANELGEQVEALRAAKGRLLAELGEPQ